MSEHDPIPQTHPLPQADVIRQGDVALKGGIEGHHLDPFVFDGIGFVDVCNLAYHLILEMDTDTLGEGEDVADKDLLQHAILFREAVQLLEIVIVLLIQRKPFGDGVREQTVPYLHHGLIGFHRIDLQVQGSATDVHIEIAIGEEFADGFRPFIHAQDGGTPVDPLVLYKRIGISELILFMVMEKNIGIRHRMDDGSSEL